MLGEPSAADRISAPSWPLSLGCPVWNGAHWAGEVYPQRTPRTKWLQWYSRTFNTVEGNSTFYGLPKIESARRWATETAEGFRFCFKFPQSISHQLELQSADAETKAFLEFLDPLACHGRLGSTFLQLGPDFDPSRIGVLETYLRSLPRQFAWAVELRNHGWFDSGENERRVNELLGDLAIDKVLFDSRPLYQSPPDDPIEQASQQRKPRTPIRQTVTAKCPMLRLVGRNRVELADKFLVQWATIVAGWIDQGLHPFVFMHAPDDRLAPQLARRFARLLQSKMEHAKIEVPVPPEPQRQLSLFGDLNPN